jgi:flagellar FliJ protein
MKPFRFRGERVLEWRRRLADDARLALVRASEAWRESHQRVVEAEASVARAARAYLDDTQGLLDAPAIGRHRNWIDAEASRAAALRGERDRCRRAQERASAVLQKAAMDVKVMERLRDRAWERYLADEWQTEMKQVNELAAQRHAQRQAGRSR